MTLEASLAAGNAALEARRWLEARGHFERAAGLDGAPPEAPFGLATAAWWLGDLRVTVSNLERAYAGFRRAPEPSYAAACALRLSLHYEQHLANTSAALGWLAHGERLIEELALDPLRGELLLMKAYLAADPSQGERWAEAALELARAQNELDLELCALSQLGALRVARGHLADGLALLDQAMAGCLAGAPRSPDTLVFASCLSMTWCTRCADFERAVRWVRAAEQFADSIGFEFFHLECGTLRARIWLATGDFERAETVARTTLERSRGIALAYVADASATLAELCLARGKFEEAERLIAGLEGHGPVIPVLARLQLLRGKPALAVTTVRRRLELIGDERLECAILHELAGEAELASGDVASAARRGAELTTRGANVGCSIVSARGERLAARALAQTDPSAARRAFDRALEAFTQLGMPYEIARTRHQLAESCVEAAAELAAAEARAALGVFERLGANADADACSALLRRLGVRAARLGPRRLELLTKREREVLALLGEGLSNPQIARRLFVSRKTVEHHVAHVLAKLGLQNRAEAAAEAARAPNDD